jgi:hypothetical protein
MTAFVFIFKSEGEGWFEGDYLINSLQKKPDSHPAVSMKNINLNILKI